MSLFVHESGLSLCLWILGSIALAIALLLLSVFEGKRDELRDNIIYPDGSFTAALIDAMTEPQEKLKQLEGKINTKSAKLEISQDKLEETKKTISQLEVTSGEVQIKYQELLRQLKSELSKTESECQRLHDQIELITTKRDKLKQELDDVGLAIKVSKKNSVSTLEEELFLYDSQLGKSCRFVQESVEDSSIDQTRRSHCWSTPRDRFTVSMESTATGMVEPMSSVFEIYRDSQFTDVHLT